MSKYIKKLMCVLFCVFQVAVCFGCNSSDNFTYVDINHIINPASGMPYSVYYNMESGRYENYSDYVVSATVLSQSSMEGDAYSTAICVMGSEKAKDFIENKILEGKITSAIIFTADKRMLIFGEIASYNMDNKFSEYKNYQLEHGSFASSVNLSDVSYKEGSYTRYNDYAFSETIEFESYIFGSNKTKKDAIRAEILSLINELDNQVNITKENSDISKINRLDVGVSIEIGEHTYKLLSESKRLHVETDGAFNVAITPLSRLWQVDIEGVAKYRAVGRSKNWTYPEKLPGLSEINEIKASSNLDHLTVYEEDGKYFAQKNSASLELDLGGIAKGYAADKAKEVLEKNEVISAQLNISGNVIEHGNYFDPSAKKVASWKIGLSNPSQKHEIFKDYICAIQVEGNISIVTSGDYERFYSFKYPKEKS